MRFGKTLGAAALAIAVMQAGCGAASAQVSQPAPSAKNPTVAIGANGTEKSAPDMAIINAGLITNDPSSEAASATNNRDFAKIVAVVKKYNVAAADMQTNGVSVRPKYDYSDGNEKMDGYTASNSLTITVRDLSKIGALLADLAAAGANEIGGPAFGLDNNEALMDKAREKAFDTAQRRALAYARKAGFKAVRLLTINENAGDMAYTYAVEAAADAAKAAGDAMSGGGIAASIEPGLLSETVYANFLFEMVP